MTGIGIAARLSISVLFCFPGESLAHDEQRSGQRPLVFAWDPIPAPKPTNLCRFVKDEPAAVQLGKAWFWEMQVGSDGVTACATCHFYAGADSRVKNQLSPHGAAENGEASFEVTGPNATLTPADFPSRELEDLEDRTSTVLFDSDDVVSSQGVFRTVFDDIDPGRAKDQVTVVPDPVFNVRGINTRQVEPRNTMSVINAVFSTEQFWDGRGKFYFNGVNPSGLLDERARILQRQGFGIDAPVAKVKVEIDMASLASQAVGPPVSPSEMSAEGRTFPKIGKKLLSLTPLARQIVHPDDSVLGPLSRDSGFLTIPGLTTTYRAMIEAAFHEEYWESDRLFDPVQNEIGTGVPANTDQYTLMEMNFSLFWGLAIQLYESTLISDDSPFDRFMAGDKTALTPEERQGMDLFLAHCQGCHKMPEITKATVDHMIEFPSGHDGILERMAMAEGGRFQDGAVYDGGFYNVGARPTAEDLGRGRTVRVSVGEDAIEQPLSFTRYALLNGEAANRIPSPRLDPPLGAGEPAAVDGAFRVPSLRNAELTGPYYHNGGLATLRDVVMFYVRGGDFHQQNIDDLDRGIGRIGEALKGRPDLQQALAKFLARPLTDDRVRFQRAPFDHPQLFVPNGHLGDDIAVTNDGKGQAMDEILEIPPVGADGLDEPLSTFLDLPPEQASQ
jgi:cytochrome c peroxidase